MFAHDVLFTDFETIRHIIILKALDVSNTVRGTGKHSFTRSSGQRSIGTVVSLEFKLVLLQSFE